MAPFIGTSIWLAWVDVYHLRISLPSSTKFVVLCTGSASIMTLISRRCLPDCPTYSKVIFAARSTSGTAFCTDLNFPCRRKPKGKELYRPSRDGAKNSDCSTVDTKSTRVDKIQDHMPVRADCSLDTNIDNMSHRAQAKSSIVQKRSLASGV